MPWTDPSLMDPLIEAVMGNVWLLILLVVLESTFWFLVGYGVVKSRWFRDVSQRLWRAAGTAKKALVRHKRLP